MLVGGKGLIRSRPLKDVRRAVTGLFGKCLLLFLAVVEMMILPTRAFQPQNVSHFSKHPRLMTSKIDVMPSFCRLCYVSEYISSRIMHNYKRLQAALSDIETYCKPAAHKRLFSFLFLELNGQRWSYSSTWCTRWLSGSGSHETTSAVKRKIYLLDNQNLEWPQRPRLATRI